MYVVTRLSAECAEDASLCTDVMFDRFDDVCCPVVAGVGRVGVLLR